MVARAARFHIAVTFDVDLTDYVSGAWFIEEFESAFAALRPVFRRHEGLRATLFLRIDSHIERHFGRADHVFFRYPREIESLRAAGHEIGWHPHCYVEADGEWRQNTDVPTVLEELMRCLPVVQRLGLTSVRMGWGFQSNEVMNLFARARFAVDSSAIPRPIYAWENAMRDWTTTPRCPYRPSVLDYRIPATDGEALPIVELPMSVTLIPAPYDTMSVERYINLAYHPASLTPHIGRWIADHNHMVTITHPYEFLPAKGTHALLAFDVKALEKNLAVLEEAVIAAGYEPCYATVTEMGRLDGLY